MLHIYMQDLWFMFQTKASLDTVSNDQRSATARVYCNDSVNTDSISGSQRELDSKSGSSGIIAKVYSDYPDYSKPTYDVSHLLDETTARAYSKGCSDSYSNVQITQSMGNLPDNISTRNPVGYSQSNAANHTEYQNNWILNMAVNVPAPTRPVTRAHSELYKMPPVVRNKYINGASQYYNPSASEKSNLPSTCLPGRQLSGTFLTRTSSDAAVQRLTQKVTPTRTTHSSKIKKNIKRPVSDVPKGADSIRTFQQAPEPNALYAQPHSQPARQARCEPPRRPPTASDGIIKQPNDPNDKTRNSETDVDNMATTQLTVEAVIEHSATESPNTPRRDAGRFSELYVIVNSKYIHVFFVYD